MTHFAIRLIPALCLTVLGAMPWPATAGLNEGLSAHDRGDYALALKELSPLAQQGQAQAQYRLGKMFNLGQGVPASKKEAARWFHLAAEQGLAEAQSALGYLCLIGEGVSQNSTLALQWTRKAAEQGNATAQFNLSQMHGDSFGIRKDPVESLKWLRKAADQRHAGALNALGALHEQGGAGVKRNPVLAYLLFDAAAAQGDSAAAARRQALEQSLPARDLRAGRALARQWKPGIRLADLHGLG